VLEIMAVVVKVRLDVVNPKTVCIIIIVTYVISSIINALGEQDNMIHFHRSETNFLDCSIVFQYFEGFLNTLIVVVSVGGDRLR